MSNATQSALRGSPRNQPGKARTAFGGIDKSAVRRTATERPGYSEIEQLPEFRELRRKTKLFIFPATAFFLAWYLSYVITAAYAPDFMSEPLVGEINVGMVMGLGQFVTTVALTWLYARFAHRKLDPIVNELRDKVDGER